MTEPSVFRCRAQELYETEGVDLSKDTIAYCRIGERSAPPGSMLHEILGVDNVKNYDGSMDRVMALVGVPVQKVPIPGGPEGGEARCATQPLVDSHIWKELSVTKETVFGNRVK